MTAKPGELVICTLIRQLTRLAKAKIEKALEDTNDTNLLKSIGISEDPTFTQLLDAFFVSAEFALPSVLSTIIQWYQSQHSSGTEYVAHRKSYVASMGISAYPRPAESCQKRTPDRDSPRTIDQSNLRQEKLLRNTPESNVSNGSKSLSPYIETRCVNERRDLPYHPGHSEYIEVILEQCFRRFKYREDLQPQNSENINLVADLYAEIVGLLSQFRFDLVREIFMRRLKDLRSREQSPNVKASIVSLIMGMKFFRVKMQPINDFVKCCTFLQELGKYFIEVKEPEIKHVLSDLFVEILLPVAAAARQEVNVPALKTFVETLYPVSLELANKKKHVPALFPLVTCLLCVGTKVFFLANWTNFMSICLSQVKSRTPKVALVSLQSLSCLLWVYIVRLRGEKFLDTQAKLHSIVNSIFPKSQKFVVPKDAPINIFVRIIQFIAHEKLEFAVKEIIIDRLGINGFQKTLLMPERMNIGLCAFLLIAHSLQQREGEPPMPQQSTGCGGLRQAVIKRSFHGTNLNDALGHRLGIQHHLMPVRRAFELILRQLDSQVCRTMMLPKQEMSQKEADELMTTDRKPKLDLLKTCVACIPRLLPDEMTKPELLEFLAKVCLHMDEDLRKMAQQAMANLIVDLPDLRVMIIQVFIQFIQKNVADTSPHHIDNCLKTLFHLLNNWKLAMQKDSAVSSTLTGKEKAALYEAEGFALVMLCHCRSVTRRLATQVLRKCRALHRLVNSVNLEGTSAGTSADPTTKNTSKDTAEVCCIDVLDRLAPVMLEWVLPLIPITERLSPEAHLNTSPTHQNTLISSANVLDFSSFTERCTSHWLGGPLATGLPYSMEPLLSIHLTTSSQPSQSTPLLARSSMDKTTTDGGLSTADTTRFAGTATGQQRGEQQQQSSGGAAAGFARQHQHTQPAYVVQPVPLERCLTADLWATCLAVAFNVEQLPYFCPRAIQYAWNVLFQRLSLLFPLIDPSAQVVENRASSLLRTSSKKPTTERDQLLPLWHNYAVLGCCIAPSSIGHRVSVTSHTGGRGLYRRLSTMRATGASGDAPATTATASPCQMSLVSTKETARDLVKFLVPLLRCEQTEVRESAVASLGRINPAAFRDALDELHPLLKESVDRKQENVRRRRRRDGLRTSLIRTLALMGQTGVFSYSESQAVSGHGYLIAPLIDYLDGMRVYLESVSAGSLSATATAGGVVQTSGSGASTGGTSNLPSVVGVQGVANPTVVGSTITMTTGGGVPSVSTPASATVAIPMMTGASTEAITLTEIRLHFCIFILELIRQIPRNRRSQLLPTVMRYQLFLLLSSWSGYHDHVMGGRAYSQVDGRPHVPAGVLATHRPASFDGTGYQGCYSVGSTYSAPAGLLTGDQVFACTNLTGSGGGNNSNNNNQLGISNASLLTSEGVLISGIPAGSNPTNTVINDCTGANIASNTGNSINSNNNNNSPTDLPGSALGRTSPLAGYCAPAHAAEPSGGTTTGGFLTSIAAAAVGAARCASAGFVTVSSVSLPGTGVQAGVEATSSQIQPSQQQANWEQRLLTDLLWLTNQAMAALVTAGSLHDCFKETICDQLPEVGTAVVPDPGYILRWISGLLVARTSVLNAIPWLWHCPVVQLHSIHDSRQTGHSGSGFIFPRAGVSAGGRRLDSLLHQLGEETLVLLLDTNHSSPFLINRIINQCYVAENTVLATSCFTALCRLFTAVPDFSCDFITMVTLTMVYVQHPQRLLSKRALYLLRVLYHRFIIKPMALVHQKWHQTVDAGEPGDSSKPSDPPTKPDPAVGEEGDRCVGGNDDDLEATLTCSAGARAGTPVCAQFRAALTFWRSFSLLSVQEVLRQFAAQHPDYTLHLFCEICRRLETARECLKQPLLYLLRPWIVNIELVDLIDQSAPHPPKTKQTSHVYDDDSSDSDIDGVAEDAVNIAFCHTQTEDGALDEGSDDSGSGPGVHRSEPETIPAVAAASLLAQSCQSSRPRPASFVLPSTRATGGSSDCVHPKAEQMLSTRRAETMPSPSTDRFDVFKQHWYTHRSGHGRLVRSAHSSNSSRALILPVVDGEVEALTSIPPTLRSTGWGSKQASELVLTNLYFLTLLFSECPTTTEGIKEVWNTLIRHRRDNLRVVLRYLIVITSLAPATLLLHSKRLITYLANEKAESVIEELMLEMQTIDGIGMSIERKDSIPYFRITTADHSARKAATTSTDNPNSTRHEHHQSGRPGHHAGEHAADLVNKCGELLKSVNRDSLRRADPEVEALFHATPQADASRRTHLQGTCQVSSPEGASSHKTTSLQRGVSRPKSATNHPSKTIGETPAGPPAHRCLSTSMTAEGMHASSSFRPSADYRGFNLIVQSYCDVLFESDSDSNSDIDTAMARHRKLSPDDKYATLKPKDLNRLLGNGEEDEEVVEKADQEEDHDCQCSETVSAASTSMSTPSTTVNDGHARTHSRTHSRTGVQLRSGTLPSTADSRARYFICSQCFSSAGTGSRKHRSNRSSLPAVNVGTGPRATAMHHRRTFPSRSHRMLETSRPILPQQTVSLPPRLACLTPLPLSLPVGVPSMPSLVLSSLADKLTQQGRSNSMRCSAGSPVQPTATAVDEDMGSLFTSAVNASEKPQPLTLPSTGGYQAPLDAWLTEPLVIGGPVVYSGSWPASGARSPLVLLLTGGLMQCTELKIDWNRHLPTLLLSVLLGIDHCRSLVQEECKQLLVSLLRLACPHQDSLALLSLQLETDLALVAYPSGMPSARQAYYNLTSDGGPFQEKFDLLIPGRVGITEETNHGLPEEHESSISPPPFLTGKPPDEWFSSFTSPRKPVRRHQASQRLRRSYPLRGATLSSSSPSTSPHDLDLEPTLLADRQRWPGRHSSPPSCPIPSGIAPGSEMAGGAERPHGWASSTFSLLSTATLVPEPDHDHGCSSVASSPVVALPAGQAAAEQRLAYRPANLKACTVNRQSPLRIRSPWSTCGSTEGGVANPATPLERAESGSRLCAGSVTKGRTSFEVVNSRQLHTAIEELRGVLLNSSGQAVWTWEDFRLQHFQQTSINYLMHQNHSDNCEDCSRCCVVDATNQVSGRPSQASTPDFCRQSKPLIVRLVQLMARILSLSEASVDDAEAYLQCHHSCSPADDRPTGVLQQGHPVASSPVVPVVARLSEVALSTGLSCPNRHYASRSLQIFRILGANLDTKSLSRVLARLGETVADTNEEIQGYVAELLLTQEAAVRHLRCKSDTLGRLSPATTCEQDNGQVSTAPNSPGECHPVEKKCGATEPATTNNSEFTRCQSLSNPERRHLQRRSLSARIALCAADAGSGRVLTAGDTVATVPSSSPTGPPSTTVASPPPTPVDQIPGKTDQSANQSSPRKVQSVEKLLCCRLPAQDRADLVCGVFWTGVFLLQSDFEHEYLFGLRLLDALLPSVCVCQSTAGRDPSGQSNGRLPDVDLCARAQTMLSQMRLSPPFPGVLPLAIKGCSSPYLVDSSCRLLVNLIPFMSCPLVMPRNRCPEELTFALLLLTLLPMMLTAWEEDPAATSLPGVPSASLLPVGNNEAPVGDLQQQQTSFLQGGGFLGRSVSGMPTKFPRALGSWTTVPYTASASSLPVQLAQSQMSQSSRLHRMDSMSFPSNCMAGDSRVVAGVSVPSMQQAQQSYPYPGGHHSGGGSFPLKPKNPVCIKAAESLANAALRINPVLLTNLALILRLYATGCFSKDADQWANCVVSYLLEGCGQYAAQLVRYMTTLLIFGPACLQMPLLKIACLVLEKVELGDSEVEDALNNFITSTSTQFLGTDLWPLATRLTHIVMSRCAVLVSPDLCPVSPPSKYACVDLNALAVVVPLPESEPPSRELAGPVVNFSFDVLREVPLLAASYVVEWEGDAPSGEEQQPMSCPARPEALTPLINPLGQLFLDAATVGKPASDWLHTLLNRWQTEVRHSSTWVTAYPLLPLLFSHNFVIDFIYWLDAMACPQAIDSMFRVARRQSTETLDPQLSVHSSSETASMIDTGNSDDFCMGETSSMDQAAVFHDLDTYLDAQLMNINFLGLPDRRLASASEDEPRRPWGVRGQSITCHTEFTDSEQGAGAGGPASMWHQRGASLSARDSPIRLSLANAAPIAIGVLSGGGEGSGGYQELQSPDTIKDSKLALDSEEMYDEVFDSPPANDRVDLEDTIRVSLTNEHVEEKAVKCGRGDVFLDDIEDAEYSGHRAKKKSVPLVSMIREEVVTSTDPTAERMQASQVVGDPNVYYSYPTSSSTSCYSPPLVHLSPSPSERSISLSARRQPTLDPVMTSSGTELKPRSEQQDACIIISVKRKPLTSSNTEDNICRILPGEQATGDIGLGTSSSENLKLRESGRAPSFNSDRPTEVSSMLAYPKKSSLRTLGKPSPPANVAKDMLVQPSGCQLSAQRCRSASSLVMECTLDKSGDELPSVGDRVVSVKGVRLHHVVDRRRNVLGKQLRRYTNLGENIGRESLSFEDFSKVDQLRVNVAKQETLPECTLPQDEQPSPQCFVTADRVMSTSAGDFPSPASPVGSVLHCTQSLTAQTYYDHGSRDTGASGVIDSNRSLDLDDEHVPAIGYLALSSLEKNWLLSTCICADDPLQRTSICDLPRLFTSLSSRCLTGVRAAANLCGFTWADTTVGSDFHQLLNIGQRIYGHLRPPFIDFSQASLDLVAVYIRPRLSSLCEAYDAIQDALRQLSKVELHSCSTEQRLVHLSTRLLLRLVDFLKQSHAVVQEAADRVLDSSTESDSLSSWLNTLLKSVVQLAVDVSCEGDNFHPVAVKPMTSIESVVATLIGSTVGAPLRRDDWEPVVRMVVNQTTSDELEPVVDKLLSLLMMCTNTGAAMRTTPCLIYTTVPAIGLVNLDVLQYCSQLYHELSQLIS